MKYILVYVGLLFFGVLIDLCLNTLSVTEQKLKGNCQQTIYPITELKDKDLRCIFCGNLTEKQFGMKITSKYQQDIQNELIHQEIFQQNHQQQKCLDLVNLTNFQTFPIVGEDFFSNNSYTQLTFSSQEFECDEKSKICNTYSQFKIPIDSSQYSISIFAKLLNSNEEADISISIFQKEITKLLEDSLVTMVCFSLLLHTLYRMKNAEESDNKLNVVVYILEQWAILILIMVGISQPLRGFASNESVQDFEWIVGQLCYSISEATVLYFLLNIPSIIIEQKSNVNKYFQKVLLNQQLNSILSLFMFVALTLERITLSYNSYIQVVMAPMIQIENFNLITFGTFWILILYMIIFFIYIYKAFSQKNHLKELGLREIILIEIICLFVYLIEKMQFYFYHAAFENYIFNTTVIISFVSYLSTIISISLQCDEQQAFSGVVKKKKKIINILYQNQSQENSKQVELELHDEEGSDEDELQEGKHDDHDHDLDKQIAQYYQEQDVENHIEKDDQQNDILL